MFFGEDLGVVIAYMIIGVIGEYSRIDGAILRWFVLGEEGKFGLSGWVDILFVALIEYDAFWIAQQLISIGLIFDILLQLLSTVMLYLLRMSWVILVVVAGGILIGYSHNRFLQFLWVVNVVEAGATRLPRLFLPADHVEEHLLELCKCYPVVAVEFQHLFQDLSHIFALNSHQ